MKKGTNKVVVVGTGAVGCSYAYSMVNQGVAEEIVLIDIDYKRAEGEAMDLTHGMAFAIQPTRVTVGTYKDCRDADIVVITAGLPQKPGETRLDLIGKNAKIVRDITLDVMLSGFNGIFVVASNPVDILSYVVYKESQLPKERVIGSGTTLDTARFRYMLGEYFKVDPRNVHASIMGEHGDSEFPVWSQASIGIERLEKLIGRRANKDDWENLNNIFVDVRDAAYHIIERKGATYYGIGMCLTRITKAVLNDENSILPVSCFLEGEYGLNELYISVPAIINRGGTREVADLTLNKLELEALHASAKIMKETIKGFIL